MDCKAERDDVIVKFLFFEGFMYNDVRSSERVYIGKEKKE